MNKRIRHLAEQATTIEEHGWGASYENFDREKFAQLFVAECAKVILETPVEYNEIDTMHRIRDRVKQHFGVE